MPVSFADGTRRADEMQRVARDVHEQVLSHRAENGPVSVELRQVSIGLCFRDLKRCSSFTEQPCNGLKLRFRLFSLCQQHPDRHRRKDQQRPHHVSSPARPFLAKGAFERKCRRHRLHKARPFRFGLTDATIRTSNTGKPHAINMSAQHSQVGDISKTRNLSEVHEL